MHALGFQLAYHLGHRQGAVHRLAAGHGDGVVVQDLVSDGHFCRHGLAYGQQARMEIGAVTQVGEDVALFRKRRLPHPGHAFAAHVGEGGGAAVHPGHHVVAADAGHGAAAFRHPRGGVVGATGTEVGNALDRDDGLGQGLLLRLQEGQACLDAVRGVEAGDAACDHPGDHGRGQLPGRGQQPVAVPHLALGTHLEGPFALLVELADDARAHVLAPVVQLLLELVLDELTLLLDHQDLFQALGELAHAFGLQGPHHAHLVQAYADFRRHPVVDAQVGQGLAHVQVGLAAGDDP